MPAREMPAMRLFLAANGLYKARARSAKGALEKA